MKNNIPSIETALKKEKIIAMLAPSFVSTFSYPQILSQLKQLGFDKAVELTFGAKMINREYHKILEKYPNKLWISSTCPGIAEIIKTKYPQYTKNLMPVDSPMIATAKICKKIYPKYKTCFISPCEFKKREAEASKYLDYTLDYNQLKELLNKNKIKSNKEKLIFDKFYNDYTKIYPLSGGLSKTAHLKGILKKGEEKIIDGISDVEKFLKKPDKKIRFLDVTFCKGGCIGGPYTEKISLNEKRKRLMHYMDIAKKECIPKQRKGIINKASGLNFIK